MPHKRTQEPPPPYDPAEVCQACGSESIKPAYHARPVLIVFGGGLQWPCAGMDGAVNEHICCRCSSCGFSWARSVVPGMVVFGQE